MRKAKEESIAVRLGGRAANGKRAEEEAPRLLEVVQRVGDLAEAGKIGKFRKLKSLKEALLPI